MAKVFTLTRFSSPIIYFLVKYKRSLFTWKNLSYSYFYCSKLFILSTELLFQDSIVLLRSLFYWSLIIRLYIIVLWIMFAQGYILLLYLSNFCSSWLGFGPKVNEVFSFQLVFSLTGCRENRFQCCLTSNSLCMGDVDSLLLRVKIMVNYQPFWRCCLSLTDHIAVRFLWKFRKILFIRGNKTQ